ncbi:MAG TPA: hypothetical protein V6D05_12205 [Stenomitos sp.]
MDREFNRQEVNVPGTPNLDTAAGPDLRRSMIMGRDVAPTHPELIENLGITRVEKVEPFGADLVHWGSIWGGFFAYLALTLILVAAAVSVRAITVAPATAPNAGQIAGAVGVTMGIILIVATFVGAVLGGWTSNLRSRWPSVVNGLIYSSLVICAPVLVTMLLGLMTTSATTAAVAQVQAARGGVFVPAFNVNAATLGAVASNVGWFSLGSILLLIVGALGYFLGMRAHLMDLGIEPRPMREPRVRRT